MNKEEALNKDRVVDFHGIAPVFTVKKSNGSYEKFDPDRLRKNIVWACRSYEEGAIAIDTIIEETLKNSFDGMTTHELGQALVLAAAAFIERDPTYSKVAAQLLLQMITKEVTGISYNPESVDAYYQEAFIAGIDEGVKDNIFDKQVLEFDLEHLAQGLRFERDDLFEYMGLRTLYERYFVKTEIGRCYELPQTFWMRIAMGLCLNEESKTECALEFYNIMSSLRYVPSTPTLLHAGLKHPQLSSCFLTTIQDDLDHIFKCFGDNARLSKWSGGVANDWSCLRATGSYIKSIQTESQGLVPFLKIANDVTAAINRSGSRRGATCAYLETWHLDIEDFLDLRKNTGDERRRTHDINTALWIPDLFIKRVIAKGTWTLFSPEEVPELHHIYGRRFEGMYQEYEEKARSGGIKKYKVLEAAQLWKKMLTRLFETGHPWFTFKDACNIRSPQDHVGVIHSSNLCTEITLNTSESETAVCNLGSINLSRHVIDGELEDTMLAQTVKVAMRMLDNVIDINYYPTLEAKNANMQHRPVGLGLMGFQDALYKLDIAFDSQQALKFADSIMEKISYNAILSSSKLAKERGAYQSFKGSKWDRGIFPIDTIALLEKERDMKIEVDRVQHLNWKPVREHVKLHGLRNSNMMAIAPTATISNIAGCFPCIEPIYKNIYVKSNMSGEFTVVNTYLVGDLKKSNLWNQDMLDQLKYYDGNVQMIAAIPQRLKDKYKEVFEIDPEWLLKLTAVRGKWIDQSQSHNVFMQGVSGKKLSNIYLTAWRLGLKTCYYLRTLGASQIEKSTLDAKKFGYTQKREYKTFEQVKPAACNLRQDPDCDACQ